MMLKADYFSYWERESFLKNIDLSVVGSGIVGLTSAILYKQKYPDQHVVVFESGVLPHGATTRNAGFACFGSLSEIIDDLSSQSEEEVFQLIGKRWDGLQTLLNIHDEAFIDYQVNGGFEIFLENQEDEFEKCMQQMEFVNQKMKHYHQFDVDVFSVSEIPASWKMKGVKHLIQNPFEGQLHSGKLMQSLYKHCTQLHIPIFNGMKIEKVESISEYAILHTEFAEIKTEKILICNNGFASDLLPDIKVVPARGQVLVTSVIPELSIEGAFHHHKGFDYFRNVDQRILIGGGRHLNFDDERTTKMEITSSMHEYLLGLLNEYILPEYEFTIEYQWSGIMGMGSDKMPIVKRFDDRIYLAVRMGGMGVAIGSSIAQNAVDIIN
jgi:gamma-glutamylputrescine oxidase